MKVKSTLLFPLWREFPENGVVQLSDSIVLDECPARLLDTDSATILEESRTFAYWSPFGHRGALLPPKDQKQVFGRVTAQELQSLRPKRISSRRDQANWALIMALPSDLCVVLRWII